jgi:hypothetical protein
MCSFACLLMHDSAGHEAMLIQAVLMLCAGWSISWRISRGSWRAPTQHCWHCCPAALLKARLATSSPACSPKPLPWSTSVSGVLGRGLLVGCAVGGSLSGHGGGHQAGRRSAHLWWENRLHTMLGGVLLQPKCILCRRALVARSERLHFVDCDSQLLLLEDGSIDPALMPDALHPNAAGYEKLFAQCWDAAIAHLLALTAPQEGENNDP